ncbi:TolC family protein [Acinetobacter sp. MB5]|uniref:TolC family protein n=1 Tax=Acinetobacter sp. MB5 TaxID=2069438 RepID=UPI000DD013FA|nr:TolC family protein [Acinetobacter sp. MB5]
MQKMLLSMLISGLLLSACSPLNVKLDSKVSVPATFEQVTVAPDQTDLSRWWLAWHDPVLTQLIQQGLQNNHDLAAARANLKAARANAALALANLGPTAGLSAGVEGHHAELSNPLSSQTQTMLSGLGASGLASDDINVTGYGEHASFAASWEPDIFGGKRSDADAAKYASMAVTQQWYAVQMLLASDIADNYFKVRSLQKRIQVGQSTLASLSELRRYIDGRFKAGQVTDYDVRDVDIKRESLKAQLATLQAQADAYQRNLAVLTGQLPQQFHLPKSVDILNHIPELPHGETPLSVLNRRPDVRQQYALIQASSAQLASAKADLLPRFKIQFIGQTGQIRLDSDAPELRGFGGLVSMGVSLPIFTAGRIQRNIEVHDAQAQAALAHYDQLVLKSLAEVDSAYQLQSSLNQQNRHLSQASLQANTQVSKANQLFKFGNITLDKVLLAQINAQNLQDKLIQARLSEAENMLSVYKTLGGGWQPEQASSQKN